MFSHVDRLQIQQKGITVEQVTQQIAFFKKGVPYLDISKPAVSGDGIFVPDDNVTKELISVYESLVTGKKIVKFVPASGAATRMFKAMFEYLSKPSGAIIYDDVAQVIQKIGHFAFYDDLQEVLAGKGLELSELIRASSYHEVIDAILNEGGLNYGNLPKGLLKFHAYPGANRTSVEEHLVEGAMYAKNSDYSVFIHFTVSPEHLQAFKALIDKKKIQFEKEFGVTYYVSFSIQKPSTDTIAVDGINSPFRDRNGSLIFRPGGHGALLDNLGELDGDMIFIKNIDNVVPDTLKAETVTYKKVLGGLLLKLQKMVFGYLERLEIPGHHKEEFYQEIVSFIESWLGYKFPDTFAPIDTHAKKQWLFNVLNRPIRVCGMVKNTGEPGGGPFWVKDKDGALTLQILESSQFNLADENHQQVFKYATHFNPVDLVVSANNYKGQKFSLAEYRDPDTGFISVKSKDGKELKALELPGLWNGSMALWNTVFVEVPVITFNPVKSVNDLLRNEHQSNTK
jgi:hypothetical protein